MKRLLLVLLVSFVVPKMVVAQATRVEWEIGGFTVALGEGQQQTLEKLNSVYSVAFDQDNGTFMVRCNTNGRIGLSVGALVFQQNKLTKVYTFEDVNCSNRNGIAASEPLDIYQSIIKMLYKVQRHVKSPCRIDEPIATLQAGAWVQCGPYHQIQFMGDKDKSSYGLLVTVERK